MDGLIDPFWQVVDLDPVTWRQLGRFFAPQRYIAAAQPGEHGLFILHDAGRLLNAVDSQATPVVASIPAEIHDPAALAQALYAQGEWQRVHVIDRRHLAWVAQQAQATPRRDLTIDAYYHLIYTLIWGKPEGYVSVPPHPGQWNGWTYASIRQFFAGLPSPATLALGVYADDALMIGLILGCQGGMIHQVTTFEALQWEAPIGPSRQTLGALQAALAAQFAPPAAMLLCTEGAFAGWLAAPDKAAYLAAARADATAIWHIALVDHSIHGEQD
jgi:hypothetical protein